jgi:hypothetical protein
VQKAFGNEIPVAEGCGPGGILKAVVPRGTIGEIVGELNVFIACGMQGARMRGVGFAGYASGNTFLRVVVGQV